MSFLHGTHFHMWPEATPFPVECQIPYRLVTQAQRWVEFGERAAVSAVAELPRAA